MIEWTIDFGKQVLNWAYIVPTGIIVAGVVIIAVGVKEHRKHHLVRKNWFPLCYAIGVLLFVLGVVVIGTIATIRLIQGLPPLG